MDRADCRRLETPKREGHRNLAAAGLLSLALVQGCATPPVDITHHFRAADYAWSQQTGTGRIVGQAFLKTMAGDVKYCAGEEIRLWPQGPYTEAVWQTTQAGHTLAKDHPPELKALIRRTTGDGLGNFEFSELPAGRFRVVCYLTWVVGGGVYAQRTGGLAEAVVELKPGETKKIVVTH